MGELIELPYRRFHPFVIQKLIRAGYLKPSDRHKPAAVDQAWTRFRDRASLIASQRGWATLLGPDDPNLA